MRLDRAAAARRIMPLLLVCLLASAALTACGGGTESEADRPAARDGVIDLRGWHFAADGTVALRGEWLFRPHELLAPDEWAAADGTAALARLPMSWNSYPESFGLRDGRGYGTYRLTVLVDERTPVLSLRIPSLYTAYRLWVNGEPAAAKGRVSRTPAEGEPDQSPQLVSFEAADGVVELLLQVSNYHHRRGGVWHAPVIGGASDVAELQAKLAARTMALFGSLAIIGLYHIVLYALRREESFTLYFGLLCLTIAMRGVVTGETLLLRWFPDIPWEAALKIDYFSLMLSSLSAYLYIYALFPQDASGRVRRALSAVAVVLCAAVTLLPAYHYSRLLGLFQLIIVVTSLYVLYVLATAVRRRRDGAGLVLFGVAVFVVTIGNDMAYYNEWFRTSEMVPLGLLFFILMQAVLLSTRFSRALSKVETVSEALRELNNHLEDRIESRTEELRSSKEKLEASNRELARLERSRRHFMANISHDLRTPMTLIQGYLEALQDGVIQGRERQANYIRMMLGKVEGLNRLIADLLELSKLEAGRVPLDMRPVRLDDWIAAVREQFELDVVSRGMAFELDASAVCGSGREAKLLWIELDERRIGQALGNLVYNAIAHMQPGGTLGIAFRRATPDGGLVVEVRDTGVGIDPQDLPHIFDRFYQIDNARGGSGIGLAIVKEIAALHGGEVEAESEPGQGATFRIALPAARVKEEAPDDGSCRDGADPS